MLRTLSKLLEKGARPPIKPTTPGEFVMFAMLLRDNSEFRPDDWESILAQGLEHKLGYVRAMSFSAFNSDITTHRLPIDKLKALFLGGFNDPEAEVRQLVCHVSGKRKFDFAIDPTLRLLKTSTDRTVYHTAALALLELGKREACLTTLVNRLDESENLGGWGLEILRAEILKNVSGYNAKETLSAKLAPDCKKAWEQLFRDHPKLLTEKLLFGVTDPATPIEKLFPEFIFSNRKQ
jgi:hypothetical protein